MGQYVLFDLDGQIYGVDIALVQSIEGPHPVTRLPGADVFVRGLINLRGTIIPVIDLKLWMGKTQAMNLASGRTVVVTDGDVSVGLLVDGTKNVVFLDDTEIQSVPDDWATGDSVRLVGIARTENFVVGLLDVTPILGRGQAAI